MEEVKVEVSIDELKVENSKLRMQCELLSKELQKSNMINMFKRLDYLFKIVENSDKFNKEFVNKALKEIEFLMTIPEENTKE